MKRSILILLVFGCFLSFRAFGQSVTVSGTVRDADDGSTIPSAIVFEEGNTSNGVITSVDGEYSLTLTNEEANIVVRFVGYKDQVVSPNGRTTINISLQLNVEELQEVVVVGYGEQKKANLTGAVQSVSFSEESNQPVTQSGQLLYGGFSGVQLTQGNGLPGNDGSSVVIRGVGSFGDTRPLVVIDGIQYEGLGAFNNLAPSDIESVTVLKDASASAIYGIRGANGVIVVTTRKGKKNSFSVNYNFFYGSQSATVIPEFLNGLDYAILMNEKFENENGPNFDPRYTEEQIEALRTGSNPDQFANTDWADAVLTTAPIQSHNLSISGGNDKTTYRVSLGYLSQEAIVKSKFKSERYTLSMNINSQPKEWLTISNVFNSFWRHNVGPSGGSGAITGNNGIIGGLQRTAPTIPLFYSNGEYGYVDGAFYNSNASFPTRNPLARGFFGDNIEDNINISERLGLTVKVMEGLTVETSGSINLVTSQSSNFNPTDVRRDFDGEVVINNEVNSLSNATGFSYTLLNENIIRYTKQIVDKHNFGVLVGQSSQYARSDGFSGSLRNFPTDNFQEFNAGGIDDASLSGNASELALLSFYGRINYNYAEKYLLEVNVRRDAASNLPPSDRADIFPSASVGWRISDEPFFDGVPVINYLKLRGSWGLSGNNRIGRYPYEQQIELNNIDYVLGNDVIVGGVAITNRANPDVRWEKMEQIDIGFNAGLLENKLQINLDYFKKNNTDLLYAGFPIPNTSGFGSISALNGASMVNTGMEFSANYRDEYAGIKFTLGTNITRLFNNEVTGLGDGAIETITGTDIITVGEAYQAYYGYTALGIFQSFDDIARSPQQFGNALTAPGDIRYADINGDGVVDEADRSVIGDPYPGLIYNFNANMEYMGFDLSVLFQGVHNIDRLIMGNGQLPMEGDRDNVLDYWINRWTPDNPSEFLPRVGGQDNEKVSTFYLRDASYLRMKNIELGYTIPLKFTEKAAIQKFRVFVGGQNLLTFSKIADFDPERGTGRNSNGNAPLYKTVTVGANLKF